MEPVQYSQADEEVLVDALRSYGVRYISGGIDTAQAPLMDPYQLIAGLAESPVPLLRHTLTSLFLLHPEFAPVALSVAESLSASARETLMTAYSAAVYLQTLWRARLRRYLGPQPSLPAHWLAQLGLPARDEFSGRLGLALLDARHRRRTFLRAGKTEYDRTAKNLFSQLLIERFASTTRPVAA